MSPINRIREFFPSDPPEPPDRRTVADKLMAGAYGLKIELLRFTREDDPDEFSVQYELNGTLPCDADNDPSEALAALLPQFRKPRREAGVA